MQVQELKCYDYAKIVQRMAITEKEASDVLKKCGA